MNNIKFAAALVFTAIFFTACSQTANQERSENAGIAKNTEYVTATDENVRNSSPAAQQVSLNQAEQTQTAPIAAERKIIRNAEIQLEASAPEETQAAIARISESKGGFVVESTQSSSEAKTTKRDTVTMTVRVPAAKFDETLNEIRQTASRVIVETVKGQDVTEEFIDIEARLKAQKALEEQFLEIMKRGNTVQDALNVQRELATVRGEIEKIEGRRRFLESQASLSTIKITVRTPAAFSANAPGFVNRLGEALGNGFDAALSFILVFVTALIALLPFLILIVLPIYLVIRYLLKKNRNRKTADEIAREEIREK